MTQAQALFQSKREVKDRVSRVVNVMAIHYDQPTRTIRVFCNDGNVRVCRIDKLTDVNHGRQMWKHLEQCIENKWPVVFKAAGGFSPDKWFYDVETDLDFTNKDTPF